MKQILIATDFSNCAGNAMEYALELGRVLNLEVCAIHAIGSMEGVNNNTYNAIYIEDYQNNKKQALIEWVNGFAARDQYKGIQVTTASEVGSVSGVITKYMEANPVEILVMGTMGSTGISGLFGSNVSAMVSKTHIPTLIIPMESKFTADPVISLATDFSSDLSAADVNALNELIAAFKSEKLDVLYVNEKPDVKYIETGEGILKKLINKTTLVFNYINDSNPTSGILKFIEENHTDILCVVKHHHNLVYRIFNRSTVNQVMNKAIKAILVLHE